MSLPIPSLKCSILQKGVQRLASAWGAALTGVACLLVLGSVAHATTPLAGALVSTKASIEYIPAGYTQTEVINSQSVNVSVLPMEALVLRGSLVLQRPVATPITMAHSLTNTGNATSSYTFDLVSQNASQCAGANAVVSHLRLVRDSNNNGIAPSGATDIANSSTAQVQLAPGQTVNLLVTGTTAIQSGTLACVALTAKTVASGVSASIQNRISTGSTAALALTQSVDRYTSVAAGDVIQYTLHASNIGTSAALPTATIAHGSNLLVDGSSRSLVLLRNVLPAGLEYVDASLATVSQGATKLCRLQGDAPLSYRTSCVDATRVIEVAMGFAQPLAANAATQWSFSAKVKPNPPAALVSTAQAYFDNGSAAASEVSNAISLSAASDRIGLALQAGLATFNRNASGEADGTMTVPLSVRIKAYGARSFFNLQASQMLEGSSLLGNYTTDTVPAAGQYTIVAGSVGLAKIDATSSAAINTAFTGQAGAGSNLLAPGAQLGASGDITVDFSVRVNFSGRSDTVGLQASGQASLVANGNGPVSDWSHNGTDPDTDNDGDPTNNNDPTPVLMGRPVLQVSKTALAPVQVTGHREKYLLTYKIAITNAGLVPATFVRVADNLNCAFPSAANGGSFASWALQGVPVANKGLLKVNSGYTGNVPCNTQQNSNTDAVASFPTENAVILTDGTQPLAPGASEEISFTVLATVAPSAIGKPISVSNKASAAALQSNTLQNQSAAISAAAAVSANSVLIDPSGVVYNASVDSNNHRNPVPGAIVTMKRASCLNSAAGPITAADLFNGNLPIYSYNSDGSVNMETNADGQYYFVFKTPPVTDVCEYQFVVTPPANSGLRFPATTIPPTPGVYTACGSVVPKETAPDGNDPTTYYLRVQSGLKQNGTACEVFANHIPLDADGTITDLALKKSASKAEVELIDFVNYTLDLTNNAKSTLTGFQFTDRLPNGFAYVPGSATLNNAPVADPAGGQGPALTFNLPQLSLASGANASLRYRVRVGVGSTVGVAVNRASARSGNHHSLEARASVKVTGGVFSEDAFLFGKVYLRCTPAGNDVAANANADASAATDAPRAEWGVPGVRLLLQNGTSVVTDSEGKWSLYGLKPQTQAIKIDPLTLPAGTRAVPLDNRNAGQGDSRFADLRKGEWHKANFALEGCDSADVVAAVQARRKAYAGASSEGEMAAFAQRLATQATPSAAPNLAAQRALPSSTAASSGGLASIAQPLQRLPDLGPRTAAAPVPVPMEDLLAGLPQGTRFMELKNNDTMATRTTPVRVQGPFGTALELKVNGVAVPTSRVGKHTSLESANVTAWEYIGVELQAGTNTLELAARDDFGNVRGSAALTVVAPGELAQLHIQVPERLRANPAVAVPVVVKLTDAHGVPVTARTQVTLQLERGTWITPTLNPNEPGLQQFIEGGQATFQLAPPAEPGDVALKVTVNTLVRNQTLRFMPDLRPMVGIGLVEGTLDLRGNGTLPPGAPRARENFEREIQGWSSTSDDGGTTAAARMAFYFKGEIKGEYLLTAAFDSDKTTRDQMFRDIQPDRYYPIYGDASVKGYDAQSTGRLFVRVDKDRSYAVLGDFSTTSSAEVRKITQTSRALSGLKHVYDTDAARVTSFVSRDTVRQQMVEVPANGTSGPYAVGYSGDLVEGSEKVEVLVRDRRQPGVILSSTRLAAFADYSFDTVAKRITLRNPLGTVDTDLNPQSLRITLETDSGGESFWVGGTDAQFKVNDRLQLGVVATQEDDPTHKRTLAGLTAQAKLGEGTVVSAEVGRTTTDKLATDSSGRINADGTATRIEVRHEGTDARMQLQATQLGTGYDNTSAGATAGSSEVLANGEYKLGDTSRLKAEVRSTQDTTTAISRLGSSVSVESQLSPATKVEVGVRTQHEESTAAAGTATASGTTTAAASTTGPDLATVRARITTQPADSPKTRVYGEYEQDLNDAERKIAAVGGDYQLTDRTRAYGRYEFLSSMANRYSLSSSENSSVAMLGVENNFAGSGRAFNEYRIADTLNGREAQNALGVRDTYKLADNLRLGGSFEQVTTAGKTATSVTGSVEYEPSKLLRTSASLELHYADAGNSVLNTLAAAYKLDSQWSLLARSSVFLQAGALGAPDKLAARQQVGFAFRPVDDDTWNILGRYEHRIEDGLDGTDARNRTHIVSALLHQQLAQRAAMSSRLAFKSADLLANGLRSTATGALAFSRVTYDLSDKWDMGAQAGAMLDNSGAAKTIYGVEAGYQVKDGLWASVGYNWSGLRDPALSAGDYTDSGVYIRLRFKFDERGLQ